jgi:hypothetical protein
VPQGVEAKLEAVPLQLVYIVKQRDVGPESRDQAEQSAGMDSRSTNLVRTAADDFAPQSGQAGVEVRRVAEQRQLIGD